MTIFKSLSIVATAAILVSSASVGLSKECDKAAGAAGAAKHGKKDKAKGGKFASADTNQDGMISRDEASAIGISAEKFNNADKNGDGQVSREELKAAKGSKPAK